MQEKSKVVIRDPVHGDISLTGEEVKILDTWPMQRLRGVRQLGTAHLVYPGATHTRFEHSIGTLHMTQLICRSIRESARERPADLMGIDAEAERCLRLAALVHDMTHIPFGHNLEDQSGLLDRHDSPDRMARAITGEEVGELLSSFGVLDEVLAILGAGDKEIPPYWQQILTDTICADILDYLARDSMYTGLSLRYDPRVLSLFRVDRLSGNLFVNAEKRGMLREDALSEVLRVLEARYYFSERVYYHHAKITAGALIARAVEEALAAGNITEADLLKHTDDSLMAILCDGPDKRAARFASLYRRRLLPKRVAVYPSYLNEGVQDDLVDRFFSPGRRGERRNWEEKIEKVVLQKTGLETDIILYCPRRSMQLKETGIHVRMPGREGIAPLAEFGEKVPRVGDLEQSYRNLWKLYLLSSESNPLILSAAAKAAESVLPGATNAYSLGS